jgi:hypothetical protein
VFFQCMSFYIALHATEIGFEALVFVSFELEI